MEKVSLTVQRREPGKGPASRMRAAGTIPGVLYGKKIEPLPIKVNERDLETATKTKAGMNVIVNLTVEGVDSGLAFIRDYQADPFRRTFTHVDFQAISIDEPIDIEVPLVLVGECKGVKEEGGVIEQARRTLQVKALPDRIPEKIEVDTTELMIGDNIHADDIKLPDGVEFPHLTNFAILSVVPPAKEEVAAPIVPLEGEAAAAVEGAAPAEGAAAAPAEGAEGAAKPGAKPGAKPAAGKEKAGKEEKA
ncbi:MAG: 50S ribosomal protein L25 [Proteobacteria bacterium]|nr:50S ribosomal protein L25 [Pseudomonadota bacterium]